MSEKVAILGASNNPERYAHMAFKLLQEYGHEVYPVNPHLQSLEEVPVSGSLAELKDEGIDTVTLYMNPQRLAPHVDEIIALKPRRVIFNPGTESKEIEDQLKAHNIEPVEACTLVLLRNHLF